MRVVRLLVRLRRLAHLPSHRLPAPCACLFALCFVVLLSDRDRGIAAAQSASSLPSPWVALDIGGATPAGNTSVSQGIFTIDAAGDDIWRTSDSFHFVYQQLTGDVEIIARVNSLVETRPWAKAGVMIRGSLAPDAPHGLALVSASAGLAFHRRVQPGVMSTSTSGELAQAPRWVRLVRIGSRVTAYSSADGTAWTTIGSDTIALGATVFVGLAVTSQSPGVATTANISNVSVLSLSLPEVQSASDIGGPAIAGTTGYRQGTYTITAGGSGIRDASDQFQYVYQSIVGDVDVAARVVSVGAATSAQAGVMIRETLAPNARHVDAMVSATQGFAFQRRIDPGGFAVATNGGAGAAPGWVRLIRTGLRVEAFRSSDGQTWTSMGSDTIPMGNAVYVGLAAASGTPTQATTAILDSLAITVPAPPNQPPTVNLTGPASGAIFTAPANIPTAAAASDPENRLVRVEFYSGTARIGTVTTAPYSMTWTSVPAGTYSLHAVAYDADGASATSSPVTIDVRPADPLPLETDPRIVSLSPTSGVAGTAVTITGVNFASSMPDGKIGWWGPFQSGVQPTNLIAGKPPATVVGSPTFGSQGGGSFTSSASSYLKIVDGGANGAYAWTSGPWAVQVDFTFPSAPVWTNGSFVLMGKGSFGTGTGWAVQVNNSTLSGKYQIQFLSNHGLGSYNSVTSYLIEPGAFHRALFLCDGAGAGRWYVNGVAGNQQPCAPASGAATDLTIGRDAGEPAFPAGLPISRVQIWNRTLTAAEAILTTTTDPALGLVTFNGTPATPATWSPTSIVVPVPALAATGPVVVTVGGRPSNGVAFTVRLPPPVVTTLSPTTGAPGTVVTISGANFAATQGTSTVTFNGVPAAPVAWTPAGITVPVPAGATTGPVLVTVDNQVSNAVSFVVPLPPPGITAISPSSGVIGTLATISGANFGATQGSSTVTFNGTIATPASWSATSIVMPVPEGTTTGPVIVTVGGQGSNAVSYTLSVSPPPDSTAPWIGSLSPSTGSVGTAVTISGVNFGSGGVSAGKIGAWGPFRPGVTPANAIAGKPAGSFVGSPAFSGDGGGSFTSSAANYLAIADGGATGAYAWTSGPWAVQLDFTFPTTPAWNGGPLMLASKGSFEAGTGWAIQINNSALSGKYQIQMVSNHGVGSYHSVTMYQLVPGAYHRALFMCDGAGVGRWYVNGVAGNTQACAPSSGAATDLRIGRYAVDPGYAAGLPISRVQIWNRALTPAEAVQTTTSDSTAGTVTFNGTVGTPTSWSPTSMVVPVPAGATTGPVVVTTEAGASSGVNFTVVAPAPPSITTVSPASGLVGAAVTIAGAGFGASQGSSTVTFNGTPAAPVSWTATSISVPVPSGATSGPLVVTTGAGASNGVVFTVVVPPPPPSITTVSPASGVVGTAVTLAGTNFGATRGTSTVTFNGTLATPASWSATSIVVPVPAGATTGPVVVTVGGQTSNGVAYTVTVGPPPESTAPWIASISPASGMVGTAVTIAGVNFGTAGVSAGKVGAWGPFRSGVAPANAIAGKPAGTFVGSPTFSSDGGGAFTSSASSYLAIADGGADGAYAWTSGAWAVQVDFAFPTTPAWNGGPLMLASKGSYEAGTGWAIQINDSVYGGKYQIQFVSNHGAGSYHSVTAYQLTPGAFHRALFVCDTAGLGVWYVNGVASSPQTCAPTAGAATDLRIGRYAVEPGAGAAGYAAGFPISRVQIWNRALTAIEAVQTTTSDLTAGTVTFNGRVGTPSSWSETSMVVPVPAGATSGPVVVTTGAGASNAVSFTVVAPPPPPSITTVSPAWGAVGTVVTIAGANFGATRGASTVTFNGTVGTPTSWSATSIVVPVPAGASIGPVAVTVNGQTSNGVTFTVTATPPSTGATYYVAPLSTSCKSTAGSGTLGDPWQNLFSALTNHSFNPGDVIVLRGGTYRNTYGFSSGCNAPGDPGGLNSLLPLNLAGTSGAPIVIQNYPSETVILDATDAALTNATWTPCGTESYQLNNPVNVGNAKTGQVWIDPTGPADPGTRLAYDFDMSGCNDMLPGTYRFNGNGTALYVRLPAGSSADLSDLHVSCESGNCASYPINDGPLANYVTVRKNPGGGSFFVKYGYYSVRVDNDSQNLTFDGIDIVAAGGRDYGSCARVYRGNFITFKNGSCREVAAEGMQLYGGGPGGSNGGGIQIHDNVIQNWTVSNTGFAWIDGGALGNNLGFGVIIKNCSNCRLLYSTIRTSFGACLEVTTSNDAGESDGVVVDGNNFSDCGYLNNPFGNRTLACMQVEPQRSAPGGAVRNGIFANNWCHNETFGSGATWPARFVSPVVYGLSMSDAGHTPMSGHRIVNNSFDYLSGPGLNLLEASQAVVIRNNAFGAHLATAGDVCNGNGPCDAMLSSGAHTHSNNTYWGASASTRVVYVSGVGNGGANYTRGNVTSYEPSAVQSDPLFVSPGDLRIQWGSALIDAGTNTDCPATDAAGLARPGGRACDIGAFEFNSGVQSSDVGTNPRDGVN